jgi:lipooligosaccharide transport system ATP-binding protein
MFGWKKADSVASFGRSSNDQRPSFFNFEGESSTSVDSLTVDNLKKVYGRPGMQPLTAVDGVSFSVAVGECFGLLGPNGAGKSTTMKCVSGFFAPTSGQVLIAGIDVHRDPKRARLELGVCAQDSNLDTDFNVVDQMVQFATFFGIPKKEGRLRSDALLERFGLTGKRDQPVESLSGGQQRRLQVARALINQPRLLVLDEPSTGLDPEARRLVWDILLERRKAGLAILLSTHYMEEAERLCDRVAIIHHGVILRCAPPQELIEREIERDAIEEEMRPGIRVKRPPNLEDVYLKLTGTTLSGGTRGGGGDDA